MKNSNLVSSKTQKAVAEFHEWLEKVGNVHLSNFQAMDRAYLIVRENAEQMYSLRKPVNKGFRKL
jgi:hypothetical protein